MKLYNIITIEILAVNEIMNKVHTIMRNEYYENYESSEATVMKVKL